MKFRSIKTKTMLLFLPLLLITVIAISTVVFLSARNLLLEQTEKNMMGQLDSIDQNIQKRIVAHERLPETLAKSLQTYYKKLTLGDYDATFQNALSVNPDTFGTGIFFEPKAYDGSTKYVSTYAYHDKDNVTVTHSYSDPSYDYVSQDWYKIAVGKKETSFTGPYYDQTANYTGITAAVPFYDKEDHFAGVVTADIDLKTVQRIVSEEKIGATGWAFMLDKNGNYLAGPDTGKIMKNKLQDDPDPALAQLAKTMLSGSEGTLTYNSAKGLNHVYYAKMPQTNWILAIVLPDQELVEKINDLMIKILIVSAAGLALIITTIMLYTRNLAAHTNRVNRMAEHLAKGDFTSSIQVKTQDEFGRMSENLNYTNVMLRSMVSKVAEHAMHVASTSEQLSEGAEQSSKASESIADTIQEVAIGAEAQMRGTQESAKALEELAISVQQIAESSSMLYDTSQSTSERALQGNEVIQQAVRDMTEANHTVSVTASHMRRLQSRSSDIGNIIDVISGISMQTNLLSLNAGIEAARAGEHGRGFAVVAKEIRKLAEQSRQSAEKVREIIEEMQEETAVAVESVESGTRAVENGTQLVEQAGESFTSIVSEIRHMVVKIQEMSAVSEQMLAGSEQVSATVTELARISSEAADSSQSVAAASEQQLASIEQISTSARSLNDMVQELQELLAQFKA